MPAWTQTQEFLRGRFKIEQDLPEQLVMTFVTQLVPGRPQAQQLLCGRELQNGEEWILLRADVCREPSLDPVEALRLTARLRAGGVALVDGAYEVRRALRLRELDLSALAELVQYLVMEAAFLRTRARPLPGQPDPTPDPAQQAAQQAERPAEPPPAPEPPGKQWVD